MYNTRFMDTWDVVKAVGGGYKNIYFFWSKSKWLFISHRVQHKLLVAFILHTIKGIFTIKFPHIGTLPHCIDIYSFHFYAFLLPEFYNYLNIYGRMSKLWQNNTCVTFSASGIKPLVCCAIMCHENGIFIRKPLITYTLFDTVYMTIPSFNNFHCALNMQVLYLSYYNIVCIYLNDK